ncbi:MAG TPA: CHASE3 domain-containing protein [Steroidobacteraceae bacterium]|jgi:PAS domain S-box-containing protein|nr:CHASE3 domain-containing protein [Steroidobacteraceae bacterium]
MQKSRSLVILAAGISVVVLIAAGVAAFLAVKTLSDAGDQLVRSKEISIALEQALSSLRDAETGQRGYLLTGRPAYLAPYAAAVATVNQQLDTLRSLSAADPTAAARFAELEQSARIKMAELARTIALHDEGQSQAALQVVLTDEGKSTMDRIRQLTEQMQAQESKRYQEYLGRERSARTLSLWSGGTVSILAIALLALLGFIVRRDTAKVRASEEQLAITLRSIGDAVIATDARGLITLMNPVAESVTGWTAVDARGASLDSVFRIINEDTRITVESPVAKVLREGGIVGLANHTLLIRRDGSEVAIEDSGAPIQDRDGGTIGVVLVFRDASRERSAERALLDADRRKDEFLATLAHELRNPLAPIRQAAKVARAPAATESQVRWAHDVIERQVQNMARLLDDLLDVSRITRGTMEIRKELVELQAVVDAAIEIARPAIEARHHALSVEYPAGTELYADPLRLAQVIANLLTNAAKYTNPHGQIRITGQCNGGELILKVTDTGIGISAEMLPRVFEMFVQVKSVLDKSEGGLGIGLALARGLAELHGGSLDAHSAGLGGGSTFTLRLPLPQAPAAVASADASTAVATRGPARRILVADDNVDSADSLAMLLRLHGHEVAVVHDGVEALRRLEEFRPQFALIDIGMPKINGYEVARRTRAEQWGASMQLIALTGWGQEQDRREALEAGFNHHLVKPVDMEILLQRLSE